MNAFITVSDDLSLSDLPDDIFRDVYSAGLTKHHAAALARISDPQLRAAALIEMAYLHIPPENAKSYIDSILPTRLPAPVTSFLSAIDDASAALTAAGFTPEIIRDDPDNAVKLTIRVLF